MTDLIGMAPPPAGSLVERAESWPPYPHPLLHGLLARALFRVGAIAIVAGAATITSGGAITLVIGTLLTVPLILGWLERSATHSQNLADASALRTDLLRGLTLEPVDPVKLHSDGGHLDPGEACFIDGARVETLVFYAEPLVQHQGFFVAWGSPLAWLASIIGSVLMLDMNRKRRKKAAPRWRDPEAAQLWVTNQRMMIHGLANLRAWLDAPFEEVVQMHLDRDGIVFRFRSDPDKPLKLRLAHPAWHQVAIQRLISLRGSRVPLSDHVSDPI